MDYDIKKAIFKIINFDLNSTNIINLQLKIYTKENKLIFTITQYLGKGSTGQVYLIESKNVVMEAWVEQIEHEYLESDLALVLHFYRGGINRRNLSAERYSSCNCSSSR